MITARREGTLAFYLSDLAERRNEQGVPLLENYQVCTSTVRKHLKITIFLGTSRILAESLLSHFQGKRLSKSGTGNGYKV